MTFRVNSDTSNMYHVGGSKPAQRGKTAQSAKFDMAAEVRKLDHSAKAGQSKKVHINTNNNKYSTNLDGQKAAKIQAKIEKENKKIAKTLQNEKSHYGMTYNEAKAVVLELKQKYAKYNGNDIYSHLDEKDKQKLNLANAAMTEIEQKHCLDNGIETDGLSKTSDGKIDISKKTDEKPSKPDDGTRLLLTQQDTGTQHTFAWTANHLLK